MKTGFFALFLALYLFSCPVAWAAFDCGSDGSDGILSFASPTTNTVVDFDPASFNPPLDPDGDGVYNFTTVTVPTLLTLRFKPDKVGANAIRWLCKGSATIDGTLDLSGEDGIVRPINGIPALPTLPGPGGFPGGYAARRQGLGPNQPGNNVKYGGTYGGNSFLLPLIGGNGGSEVEFGNPLNSSGSGGGALLLASNKLIRINGTFLARGGKCTNDGGGGGGGAIRLIAPTVAGSGNLDARGGPDPANNNNAYIGDGGIIRIETLNDSYAGSIPADWGTAVPVHVYRVTLLQGQNYSTDPQSLPRVRMLSIGGVALPAKPTGKFTIPDSVLNTGQPVVFALQANNVPLGTVLTIYLFNETADANVSFPSSALSGTIASSTATAIHSVASGYTRGLITASW